MPEKDKTSDTNVSYWLYDTQYISDQWNWCRATNHIVSFWDALGDYKKFKNQNSIATNLKKIFGQEKSFYEDALTIWNFAKIMKEGDIVIATKGNNTIVALGRVIGKYEYKSNSHSFNNRRSVKWEKTGEWIFNLPKNNSLLFNLNFHPETIAGLENIIENKPTKQSLNKWIILIDKDIINFKTLNIGDELRISLNQKYFKNIKADDTVYLYDYLNKKIVGSAFVFSKEININSLILKKIHDRIIPVEKLWPIESSDSPAALFIHNPSSFVFKLSPYDNELLSQYEAYKNIAEKREVYNKNHLLKEVFITEEKINRLEKLIIRKKNIILQGAPGVGKTFSAKRLAFMMMGEKDNSRVEMVQFHQNYCYEDFIMGYKPTEEGSFSLKTGIFYDFCLRAANDPSRDYYFIIDEINRGNLSKIFGELLQLIEADYRDKPIRLAYNKDKTFSVPSNLFIIGMMNTADRSLAMIDYALRRRFSFFDMQPGFDSKGFKEYQREVGGKMIGRLVEAVKKVNEQILADDSLGKGFLIGHSYLILNDGEKNFDMETAESIIEYDLIPLVEEYWFDNESKAKQARNILRNALKDDY